MLNLTHNEIINHIRFLIGLWPWDEFTGHTDLVAYWVRLADLVKLLISSWVNLRWTQCHMILKPEKIHTGIKLTVACGV